MGFFNRKKQETPQDEDALMDFLSEEEEQENEFQPSDDIVVEEDAKETKGRRLKNNVIIGGITAAVLLGGFMIFYDKIFPPEKPVAVQQDVQTSAGVNPMGNVPGSYEDLAKFDAARQQKLKEEEMLRQKQEEDQKKNEEAKAHLQAPAEERRPVRQVEVPRASAPSVSPPSISAPSISAPSIGGNREENAGINSAIAFNVGGDTSSSVFGIYSTVSGSKVDMRSAHTVHAGTVIPAVLLSGIDTRSLGMVTAQVRQDTYDSLTGQRLIIPQGSRLIGKATGTGRRVAVAFERIILPDGSSIKLPEQKAVDNQGYGGMKDKYDTHDDQFYRGALISGLMGYISDLVDDKLDNKSGVDDNGNSYSSAMKETVREITDHIMDRADKTEPASAKIRPGYQFNVMLTEDLTGYEYAR